jgi:hypothetical protein
MSCPNLLKILTLCLGLLLAAPMVKARAADTVRVRSFDRQTIVTDPSKGFNLYKTWSKFPSVAEDIRKIILRVTFGCPDSLRCADWDYKDHLTIRRSGGVKGQSQDYEIGRMLTPYGGAFSKNWQFSWEVDVTDFSMLLRDSVEIEYNHTGYEPNNDRGWSVTLDFLLIKGKPVWQPLSIQKIYDGSYRYGDNKNPIENALKPVSFTPVSGAQFARLRVVQTGHGMDKPDNCAEFCNKYRELWYDGKLVDKRAVWKPCGNNPLYPQAGTWVYDRANWCPGVLMQPDSYDLPLQGRQHTIDLNMEHYTSPDPSAYEVITAYLVQYRKAPNQNDVSIEDIIAPSLKDVHRRQNPASFEPQVLVKNNGSETVKQLNVQYGVKGCSKSQYKWKGELKPGTSTLITLPGLIARGQGLQAFEAELLQPNGKRDAYGADNKAVSYFERAPVLDSTLIVYLATNKEPAQNGYQIIDAQGRVIRERALGSLAANTVYRDTIKLLNGHYRFQFTDTAGNGLEFWANPRGGRGKLRLLNSRGEMIKDFESDFGSSVHYSFSVGGPVAPVFPGASFGLYPTRTNDVTTFDFYSNLPEDLTVRLITDPGGEVVEEHLYKNLKEGMFTYDLSRYPKGRFYLSVWIRGEEKFKKRIRLKE